MMKFFSKIIYDEYFNKYSVYFFGSMIVAFFNYLLHPLLARFISPEHFGDVQAFLSLISQFGIIFGAFFIMSVHISTNTEDESERNRLLSELQKICFYLTAIIVTMILSFSVQLKGFLNLESYLPLFGMGVMVLISTSTTIRSAFLQGKGMFNEFSVQSGISSIGRILFALPCLFLGFGLPGVICAVIAAQLVSFFYLAWRTNRLLSIHEHTMVQILDKPGIRGELKYGLLVLFGSGFTTFIYSADVLIVKHFFNSYDAGLYSGVSSIAKILFIILTTACAIILSMVKIKNTKKENSMILFKSMLVSCLFGAILLTLFFWQYDIIVRLIIGSQYLDFANLLPQIGLTMFLLSVVSIFVSYFLALRRFILIGISLISVLLLAMSLIFNHTEIHAIIFDLQSVLAITIMMFVAYYVKSYLLSNNH